MKLERVGFLVNCTMATFSPDRLLSVMLATPTDSSLELEPFCRRRPRNTVQSEGVLELGAGRTEIITPHLCVVLEQRFSTGGTRTPGGT